MVPNNCSEARRVSVPVGTPPEDWFQHPGEEFVHILEGSLFVEFRDGRIRDARRGDSLWYYSNVAHRWSTPGAEGAEVLIVNGRVPTNYEREV